MKENVTVYFDGKPHEVREGDTLLTAMEQAGYDLVKGVGCRQGFCGACPTLYRKVTKDSQGDVCFGLACQTKAEEGMQATPMPTFPLNRQTYDITSLQPTKTVLQEVFPEITDCIECELCTNSCPRGLEVMDYIKAARQGDLEQCAALSYNCVSCNICSTRCPANISQPQVGNLSRRLVSLYVSKESKHLTQRVNDIQNGEFDFLMKEIMEKSNEEMTQLYNTREIEA